MTWLVAILAQHVTWRDTGAALARITLRKRNCISLLKPSLDGSLLLQGTELSTHSGGRKGALGATGALDCEAPASKALLWLLEAV
jgi:hypothetical protein